MRARNDGKHCRVRRVGYLLHLHIICINKLSAKQRNYRAALRDAAQRRAALRGAARRRAVPRSAALRTAAQHCAQCECCFSDNRDGGVLIYVKELYNTSENNTGTLNSIKCEALWIKIQCYSYSVQGLDNTTAELPCQHHQVSCCFTPTSVLQKESATRRSY